MSPDVVERRDGAACLRDIAPALLERWMRDYYFDTDIDLGSSGVFSFSLREVQEMCGPSAEEMAAVVFDDSRTQGAEGLRGAIARRLGDGDAGAVMATHGSSEAIHLVMNALLSPGDEVVVLEPVYQQLSAIAGHLGCRLKKWVLPASRHFAPSLDDLAAVLTPRTRMVVVNFPHNPCGVALTAAQQHELLTMVSRVGSYLVWDGAFAELTYTGEPPVRHGDYYERVVTLGTLSKAYGLPGLRVGWLAAPPEVIAACLHLRDYLTLHLSPLVELIAQRAVENADRLLSVRLPQVRRNLDCLREWAAGHEEWVEFVAPQGGVSTFPRLRAVGDSQEFCRRLAATHKVLLVPGTCFGHAQHVRLGFGGSPELFPEGLRRLSEMLAREAGR